MKKKKSHTASSAKKEESVFLKPSVSSGVVNELNDAIYSTNVDKFWQIMLSTN